MRITDPDFAHVVAAVFELVQELTFALLMAILVDWWRHRRRRA
jgi:hypothetical protein